MNDSDNKLEKLDLEYKNTDGLRNLAITGRVINARQYSATWLGYE